MLDMFKRPGDPEEHNYLYAIPTGTMLAAYAAGYAAGVPEVASMTYLASSAACIGAIACLANQKTARTGNALGMMGVTGGIAATAGVMAPTAAVATQLLVSLGAGLGAGSLLAQRMKITELPQMVAAFHSLVRAACSRCRWCAPPVAAPVPALPPQTASHCRSASQPCRHLWPTTWPRPTPHWATPHTRWTQCTR
jgi:H+-translocating NAD(P) transhydrogenase